MFKPPQTDKIMEILKIAAPCIAEQLLMVSVNIISVAIIGHLGSNELVAASMTNTIVNWLQSIYIGLSTGGTVVIARMWGNDDKEGVKTGFMQNLLITLLISLLIFMLTMVFKTQIITFFFGGATESILKNIHIYFFYSMIGMPATAIITVINAGVRGVGDNKTPFYSTVILNILNLILTITLIGGVEALNIPQMGIAGAGIAVICAKYACAAFTLVFVCVKKSPVLPHKLIFDIKKRVLSRMLKIGLPSMLEQLVFNGGFVILQTMLISFGTAFQGGYQIGSNLNGLTNAPVVGLSVAVTVLVSQALGKRDFEEAESIVRISKLVTVISFVFISIALFILAPVITRIYTSEAQVLTSGIFFTRLFGVVLVPIAYFQIMAAILRGSGDVRYVAVTGVVGLWVMRLFGVWLIGKLTGNGYIAVAIGLSSDFVLRAILYHFRVKKGKWKYIRI